ncbi:MAG: PIN domain-containing protein [Planctomycetota bacterium]|nr:MAG: PIN domain-containing protein [Planctomycetota bacterium]
MNAVLDTCALLDVILQGYQPPIPSPWAASAISWCEIAWKERNGQLDLGGQRHIFFADLINAGVVPIAIDHHHTLAAVDVQWSHRDPADRLIVALASSQQLPLITRDRLITAYYHDCRW